MYAAGGRFEVDERSGVVRTRGTDLFQLDMEYVLYVKAEDQNGRIDERRFQSTPEERLSIVGGKRAPQFYMTAYEAEIPENQKKDSELVRKFYSNQPILTLSVCILLKERPEFFFPRRFCTSINNFSNFWLDSFNVWNIVKPKK